MKKKISLAIVGLLMFSWLVLLNKTDSIYAVYVLVGLASFAAFASNIRSGRHGKYVGVIAFSVLFDLFVLAANYALFKSFGRTEKFFALGALPLGGFFIFYHILLFLRDASLKIKLKKTKKSFLDKYSAKQIYLAIFIGLSLIYVVTLVLCCYPGVLTADSVSQLAQIDSGAFSNHHPFYHTMLIKAFYSPTFALFGNRNFSIFCYAAAQAIIMAAIFSYSAITLYQLKINRKFFIGLVLIFALLPCHLVYSFTIWKDILFGGGTLLYIVALYRYAKNIGNKRLNLFLFAVGSLMISLLRNNGFYVFVASFIVLVIMFRKQFLAAKIVAFSMLILSVAARLALPVFGVFSTETTESLSIPLQQIARVVVDDGNLTDDEKEKIDEIAGISDVKELYLPYISDPIKWLVRSNGYETYLGEHKMDFIAFWLEIGLRNPKLYAEAYSDQTRGYWNGGYVYWNYVLQNDLEPERDSKGGVFYRLLKVYISVFNEISVLRILVSIGLYVWLTIIVFYLACVRRDKIVAFMTIIPLGVIATLAIATPVYAEFRYAYSVFCCLPFMAAVLFAEKPSAVSARRLKKQ